jgi:hypothetical protein
MRSVIQWYKELKGFRKIFFSFLLNWFYWGFGYLLIYYVFPVKDEQIRSLKEYLITVTIGAFFWTLLYNINYKKLFRRTKDKKVQVSDTRDDEQKASAGK